MAIRKIIKIDEEKCDGCGLCMPDCPEGALQLIDRKVRSTSDLFCDGLGACIKHCPLDAIKIEEREAKPYDEKKVMKNIVKAGKNTIIAHLKHLKEHGETGYFAEAMQYLKDEKVDINLHELVRHDNHLADKSSCPGTRMMDFTKEEPVNKAKPGSCQWPTYTQTFKDVSTTNPFCTYIEALNNNGISSGCAIGSFCPNQNVFRDQMSKFIVNAFGFTL